MKRDSDVETPRRLTVVVEGRVQGVGFRFNTVDVASRHAVSGYVRNEPDGSVRIVAEGAERELLRFLGALRASSVYRFVRGEQVQWAPATGEYRQFEIRYG